MRRTHQLLEAFTTYAVMDIFVGMSTRKPGLERKGRSAFTLVEMLCVLTVVGIVAALAVPGMQVMFVGSALTHSGQIVTEQLALAQQKALSTNHTIEVRFYQFADPTMPGESTSNPASGQYRAMQMFDVTAGNVPLTKVLRLATSVVIDSSATCSTLISSASSATVPQLTNGAGEQVIIPQAGTAYNVVAFQFTPGGATNLLATGSWFLTLRGVHDSSNPPVNFVTIQIDPTNGHIKDFRP
jgi:uncharacterized protein (TIGR02596 family)